MTDLFTLGEIGIPDFLFEGEKPRGNKHELALVLDDDGTVRLKNPAPAEMLYGRYWYRSGINQTMKDGLGDIVKSILSVYKVREGDLWIDIAHNDGTMFDYIPQGVIKVGIDPADDTFKEEAEKKCDLVIQDYFSAEAFNKSKFGHMRAKVITSIAMFYDIEDREAFLCDLRHVLDDDGLWVLQMSYAPLMLKQLAFDNICSEHYYYYSLFNIRKLLARNGFKVMDCTLNDINGGSFRLFVMKDNADVSKFASQPMRDVAEYRISSLLRYEDTLSLDEWFTWDLFFRRIDLLKWKVVDFIDEVRSEGKTVFGYGASTKGNTLLQYFGLDESRIDAIADRSPQKWGRKTAWTNIPIISEEEMRMRRPDYLLILPWHFITEFKEREKDYLNKSNGHFIIPCPKFEII